ncbi:MAG: DUF1698 domain-containing protein [Blastocatellia bacterium]
MERASAVTVNEEWRNAIDERARGYSAELSQTGWWHSIDLGDGLITPGVRKLDELQANYARFQLPADLRGKRVLDIGCWDGFYTFEAERRGAEVVAIDRWEPEKFAEAHRRLHSRAEFHKLSVYQLSPERLGTFDIVFFMGVLYHLRHPLLALEKVCSVTRGVAIVESQTLDNVIPVSAPVMEFYEMDGLAGEYDNWWRPNGECLIQMTRSAGFAEVHTLHQDPAHLTLKAYRQWTDIPADAAETMPMVGIINAIRGDQVYPLRGYAACLQIWVKGIPAGTTREQIRVVIGEYGAGASHVMHRDDGTTEGVTVINVPIPPGPAPGAAPVRVYCGAGKSDAAMIELISADEWACA